MYQPGDVVLIPFPFSDAATTKKRPVLVLQPADHHGDAICLAITSRQHHPQSTALDAASFVEGTLPKPSWVRYSKIYTLNESLMLGRFGSLRKEVFAEVRRCVCHYLGC